MVWTYKTLCEEVLDEPIALKCWQENNLVSTEMVKMSDTPKKKLSSDIWNHFSRMEKKGECRYCKKVISFSSGSASNLRRHLKAKHPTVPYEHSYQRRSVYTGYETEQEVKEIILTLSPTFVAATTGNQQQESEPASNLSISSPDIKHSVSLSDRESEPLVITETASVGCGSIDVDLPDGKHSVEKLEMLREEHKKKMEILAIVEKGAKIKVANLLKKQEILNLQLKQLQNQ